MFKFNLHNINILTNNNSYSIIANANHLQMEVNMLDILLDTIIDSLKILPFLFVTYLFIEFIGHRSSHKLVSGLRKYGVAGGALLGSFPQCGFSVAAANLYTNKVISVGTLIAVFISTSDEAIPVIIANSGSLNTVISLILTKVVIALAAGLIADRFFSGILENKTAKEDYAMSHHHHFHDCHGGIINSAIRHTFHIFIFMVITIFLMNLTIYLVGEENLSVLLLTDSMMQPAVAALIGFIPNCASSIILTQLYLSGSLSLGSVVAGLSTGAGVGLIVLFKENKNVNENIKIMLYIYIVSTLAGSLIQALV